MIWFALIIPVIVVIIGWVLFQNKIVWWELFIPLVTSFITILVSYFIMESISLSDVEYNGYLVTEARYYEPYETWVTETCSRECCCDEDGENCSTEDYDCSYCDNISERYTIIDTKNNEITINKLKYESF